MELQYEHFNKEKSTKQKGILKSARPMSSKIHNLHKEKRKRNNL